MESFLNDLHRVSVRYQNGLHVKPQCVASQVKADLFVLMSFANLDMVHELARGWLFFIC